MSEITQEIPVSEIVREAAAIAAETNTKPADPGPKRCHACGRFMKLLEADPNEFNVPKGWYCCPCDRHLDRKNIMSGCLSPTLIQLLKEAPLNESIRSQVHSVSLVPVPPELKDYAAIKRWFEFDIKPIGSGARSQLLTPLLPPRGDQTAFSMIVSYRARETGTCEFTRTVSGRGAYEISANYLLDMALLANESGENLDILQNRVYDWFQNQAIDSTPDTDVDDEDTSEHEVSSTRDESVDLERGRLSQRINDYLYAYHRELYESLYNSGRATPPPVPVAQTVDAAQIADPDLDNEITIDDDED